MAGNCCTHGAGLAEALRHRDDVRIITGYETDTRRRRELEQAMQAPLAGSYGEIVGHSKVDIVVLATNPCEKADLVELAAAAGKHVLHNKPFADSLTNARRIQRAVADSGIKLVHDIPMVRAVPMFAKLKQQVHEGSHGRPISYAHCFGMNFAHDFPITQLWPERFDPPEVSGGGEMTNMGCYAIDYVVALFGLPRTVQARRATFWDAYRQARVENFGQIILDYGDFYALLSVGKQQLDEPRHHTNWLSVQFPNRNLLLEPHNSIVVVDGVQRTVGAYVGDCGVESSLDELIRCVRDGSEPDSDAATAARGVEVLMGAYQSALEDGALIELPVGRGDNPLVAR